MPFRTAIKWTHRFVTLSLLILVGGFLWLNHQPDPRNGDELQRVYQVSDSVWLYITVNDKGGATVPTIYRYYLSKEIHGEGKAIIRQLATRSPFLVGTGSITDARIDKTGMVNIAYSGKVFSIQEDISNLRVTIAPSFH